MGVRNGKKKAENTTPGPATPSSLLPLLPHRGPLTSRKPEGNFPCICLCFRGPLRAFHLLPKSLVWPRARDMCPHPNSLSATPPAARRCCAQAQCGVSHAGSRFSQAPRSHPQAHFFLLSCFIYLRNLLALLFFYSI